MKLNNQGRSFFYFLIAFLFLNTISTMLLLAAVTFALKQPLSAVHFPLSVLIAIVINHFAAKYYFQNNLKPFLWSTLLCSALFIIGLIIACFFYDLSWDGQWYHQETLIQLKNGWNPFYQELGDKVDVSIWLDHYGKGAEIPQAIIYIFFNKIEAGKVTNILLLLASFFLSASFLFSLNKLKPLKIYLISAFLVLCPIYTSQLLSYDVDIQLGYLLLCILVICCYIFINADKYKLFLLGITICTGINIKFTAIPYIGIFIIGALLILFCNKQPDTFKKVFLVAAAAAIVALVFIGFNPYVTNTVRNGHPFYPLAGKGKMDIMRTNTPYAFQHSNRFYNLAVSIFSPTANVISSDTTFHPLKVPFSFRYPEMNAATIPDVRVGGFGFWFSGIIILSTVLLIIVLIKSSTTSRFLVSAISITILLSVFIMEHAWWARYVSQLWFLPIIILISSELIIPGRVRWLKNLIYISLFFNVGTIGFCSLVNNLIVTQRIKDKIAELKSIKDNVEYANFTDFKSARMKLIENNIVFTDHQIKKGIVVKMDETHTTIILKRSPPLVSPPEIELLYYKMIDRSKDVYHKIF